MLYYFEICVLFYIVQQMYDLVVDVVFYFKFLFWMVGVWIWLVIDKGDYSEMLVDLVVFFKVFCESFGSCVLLWFVQNKIDMVYIDGLFKYFESIWMFWDVEGGCEVLFEVDFEFWSKLF